MKKLLLLFSTILGVICLSFMPTVSRADETESPNTVNLYLFYGQGCPHCAKEREFLADLSQQYSGQVTLYEYEVYYDKFGMEAFVNTTDYLKIDVGGVPFLVVGERYVVGYESDRTTGKEIQTEIDRCLSTGCIDSLNTLLLGETEESTESESAPEAQLDPAQDEYHPPDVQAQDPQDKNINTQSAPQLQQGSSTADTSPIYLNTYLFGNVDLKSVSLPIATTLIAFVDGFNPCAMWILIFLITMLINMKDRKKLYILGTVFIVTSGLVYLVFLSAWFNFFKFIGYVYWIKVIIGIVAIASGVLHIKNSLYSKGECHATSEKQRRSIMDRIKHTLSEQSYLFSIAGIITLAVSVNFVEIVCSAGLPAVYTNLLSSIQLSTIEYYLYLLLYVIIFMLDDLFVFFIAIKTFEVTGIAKKYTKWSGLIGGIVILVIGIILIVKPELLMFG